MRHFGADLWRSFIRIQGTLLSALSLVLAIGSFFYTPAAEVRFNWKWVAVAAPLALAVCATFADMLITARRLSYPRLPRVINVYCGAPEEAGDANEEIVLLMEPSDLFGFDGLVSIYYHQRLGGLDARPFERRIGVGRVSNIQEDRFIQVTVLRSDRGHESVWQRIREPDTAILSEIRVKPTVSYRDTGFGATFDE